MASLEHRVKRMEQLRNQALQDPLIITTRGIEATVFRGGGMELHRKPGESETQFITRGKQWAAQHRLLFLDAVATEDEMEAAHA